MNQTIAMHTITQRDAAHVLGVAGIEGGIQPGSFMEKLIEAAMIADETNRDRLERGFEGLISAVRVYKQLSGGVQILQDIAGGK